MSQSDDPGHPSRPPRALGPAATAATASSTASRSTASPSTASRSTATAASTGSRSTGSPPTARRRTGSRPTASRRTAGSTASRPYGAPAAYGQYGYSAVPAQPGARHRRRRSSGSSSRAFGVLVTLGVFLGGAAWSAGGALDAGDLGTEDPFAGDFRGRSPARIGGVLIVIGLLALAWTVRHDLGLGVGADRPQPRPAARRRVHRRPGHAHRVLGSILDSTSRSENSSDGRSGSC